MVLILKSAPALASRYKLIVSVTPRLHRLSLAAWLALIAVAWTALLAAQLAWNVTADRRVADALTRPFTQVDAANGRSAVLLAMEREEFALQATTWIVGLVVLGTAAFVIRARQRERALAEAERNRDREALRASEAQQQFLLGHSPAVLYICRPSGDFGATFLSENVQEQLGYATSDFVQDPRFWANHIHPEDAARVFAEMEALFTHDHLTLEYRFRHQDGTYRWMLDQVRLVRAPTGEPTSMIGTWTDITDRRQAEAALVQAKEFSENLIHTANVIFVELTIGGEVVRLNAVAEAITGYSAGEIEGQNWFAVLVPRERYPNVWEEFERITDSGAVPRTFENPILTKSGDERYIVWQNSLVYRDGQIAGTISFGVDITERKRAEVALRRSDATHASMVTNISDVIGIIGVDGIMKYKSPNIEKLFGWAPHDLVGTDGWLTVHPDDLTRLQQAFATLLEADRTSITVEYKYKCKDGSYKPIELTATNLTNDPNVDGVLLNYHDISARQEAARELTESHLLLSNLARLVPGVIYQYRLYPDGRSAFPYSSPGMNDIYEVTPEDVREDATPVFGRLHPDDYDNVANAIQESARTLQTFHCEFRVVLPRQGLRWRWSQAHPERMEDGGTLWHGIISDITDRKRAEAEKAALEAQLQQAQKLESVGRLAGGVAHDFNNMLAVILGHGELALDQVEAFQPVHRHLLQIEKAAGHSAELTSQLLAFARRQTIAPKVLDLNERITAILKMLQRLIGEDIALHWNQETGLWPVKIDPTQVDQLLTNLCLNARDAITGVGELTIQTRNMTLDAAAEAAPGDYVVLAVSDTGAGMSPETLAHLFEPFFTTKELGRGTGLGLATVHGIAGQNGGFVTVSSELGVGTTFTIYLPRHVGTLVEALAAAVEDAPHARGETILLVEDEPGILELATEMLERQGYTVLAAGAPEEALRIAREHAGEIHLLMTDVVMPAMNGRDLVTQVVTVRPRLKSLFMSGYTADVIAGRGALDVDVHFLQKPFNRHALAVKVRQVLDAEGA